MDAIAILEYIAQDNLTSAYDVYEAIQQQVSDLAEHPNLGRIRRIKGTPGVDEIIILLTH